MKPLLSLSGVLVALSFCACGRNTPGVAEVSGQAQQNITTTLEAEPVASPPESYEMGKDYYWPQLVAHDSILLSLLSDMHRGMVKVKKALPEEGIDRPYIEVTWPQFSESVLIFPYLDTLSGALVLSKIVAWPGEYIIAHQEGWVTTAKWIVAGWMNVYLSLLWNGQTVNYPVYEEDADWAVTRVQ